MATEQTLLEKFAELLTAKLDEQNAKFDSKLEEQMSKQNLEIKEQLERQNHRFQEMEKNLLETIELQEKELNSRIDIVDRRIDVVDRKMDNSLARVDEELDSVQDKMSKMKLSNEDLARRVTEVERRNNTSSGSIGGAPNIKAPRFDGTSSWTVFLRQFEAVAIHNGWSQEDKAAHLVASLLPPAADVLYGLSAPYAYSDLIGVLDGRYGEHRLAAAYRSQLKSRFQQSGETLQQYAAEIERLAHRAFAGLPLDHVRQEAGFAFIDGIRDGEIKKQLVLGSHRTLGEALEAAMRLEAAKMVAATTTSRIREVRLDEDRPPRKERRRYGAPECWECGVRGHLRVDCPRLKRGSPRAEGETAENE